MVTSGIVTLTTDFGADGPYVAAMKGVILGLAPDARLVDVSHAIPPQDIREAGFVLAEVAPYFPPGTIHLAVVDPGVGTDRRLVAVRVDDRWFLLPDNGLIGPSLRGLRPPEAWEVRNPAHRLHPVSDTFHGRDILAPAAGFLLRGGDPADLGPPARDLIVLPASEPSPTPDGLAGEVISVDPFGNLITNLTRDHLATIPGPALTIAGSSPDLIRTYGERPPGDLVALVGSSGRLEIAVVNGSAARLLGVGRGVPVRLHRSQEPRS
ncbi:SAM hydrolase/SAM-dependent halogenase family protein [Tundrisphaera sp. TA3]|uniref:SAM hydrolase/SAM-dependent halogenase family protein n=1 Tax=Tundrisphaera sp. TA3 TaxID=3435775 RepID=UPI003EC023E3